MTSVLAVLAILGLALAVGFAVALITYRRKAREEQAQLRSELQTLAVYRQVRDATAEAERLIREARERADAATQQAEQARSKAEQDSRELLAKAGQDARLVETQARERAESLIRSADSEAKSIVDSANKRALEIAGHALHVAQNADHFEQVAKAMKNIIEGYGDQYVIPSQSLLDDLAKEYGFTQPGEQLRLARERTRSMVKNNTAATCDYVEQNRRETAVRFVVDAFNGKVDSTLSRVKDDNFGTLEQEIRDAFNLVNHNGTAFRNARILEGYLKARTNELRWAAAVQEIKLRDREEQRRIKEKIREEERAQREFERSMREAAKEEETLRKAMEKVQGQVAKANEAQRQKYESQLAELAERLRQAEEKNQRAKSMAEQTRMGHVYVISNIGSFGDDVYKIGLTRRLEPLDRIRELGDASVPFSFDVHALLFSEDAPALERALHKHFLMAQVNKVNPRKEFFRVSLSVIRAELEKLGIQAKWTLAAEAREYRETQALEKAIQADPERRREWLRLQEQYDPATEMVEEEQEALAASA